MTCVAGRTLQCKSTLAVKGNMGAPSRLRLHWNKSGIDKTKADPSSVRPALVCTGTCVTFEVTGKSINTINHKLEMLETITVAYYLQSTDHPGEVCIEGQVPEFFKAEEKACRL